MSESQPPLADTATTVPAPDAIPAGEAASTPSAADTPARRRPKLGVAVAGIVLLVLVSAIALHGHSPTANHYIALSMLLFVTGAFGVLVRRNALVLFMCIELMLNAVNIAFVTFARMFAAADGHVMVLFVMIVAAAEVAVGLAIIVSIFRRRGSTNVDDLNLLKW